MQPHDVAIALQTGLQASALGSAESFQFVRVGLERQAARLAAQSAGPWISLTWRMQCFEWKRRTAVRNCMRPIWTSTSRA